MSEEKKKKVAVPDLKPSTDAKGGRHGHHGGHHGAHHLRSDKSGGFGRGEGRDRDSGPPWL